MSDIDEGLSYQNGWIDGQRASADRIEALEAALAKADELAGVIDGVTGKTWASVATMEECCLVDNALTAYREAQK